MLYDPTLTGKRKIKPTTYRSAWDPYTEIGEAGPVEPATVPTTGIGAPTFSPATKWPTTKETTDTGFDYSMFQPYQAETQAAPTAAAIPPRRTGETTWTTGTQTAITDQTITPVAPGIPMPKFELPAWSEERVKELRRKYMAPIRATREGLRRTLAALPSTRNLAVARELGRGAVEAFGTSVSKIAMGAGQQALSEYERRRAEEIAAVQANFQAAMQDYMARWGKKVTGKTVTTAEQRRRTAYEFGGGGGYTTAGTSRPTATSGYLVPSYT